MPEHLKALVVILILATTVFAFAKAPACALAFTSGDFARRRNLWFAITFTVFLAHNFWIYVFFVVALLLIAQSRETNKLAMFFFVLFAVPAIDAQITGLGIIAHFFTIDYIRLLTLTVLLPAFLSLRKQPDNGQFGRLLPDKLIVGYVVLNFLLMLTVSTFTNTLRHGVFYAFIDIFLPYYVASRSLKNLQGYRDAMMAFGVAALVLSAIAAFEFARHWLLYSSLNDALGARWGYGNYMERGAGSLRAQGSAGQPIALGYVLAVAAGLFQYLKKSVSNSSIWNFGMLLLVLGLIASVSRGPWMGAVAMLVAFLATGASAVRGYAKLGLLGVIVLPVLLATSAGEKIVAYLPFFGSIDSLAITYRQRLLEISVQVILQNPFFGAFDYIYSSAMQELKQGEGIIDLVNTYLSVGLGSGLIGLALFLGFFAAVAIGIFNGMRTLADRNGELYLLGQTLFTTLLGILVIIATVSSITIIPVIYWSMAGLGVGYTRMLAFAKESSKSPEAAHSGFRPVVTKKNG